MKLVSSPSAYRAAGAERGLVNGAGWSVGQHRLPSDMYSYILACMLTPSGNKRVNLVLKPSDWDLAEKLRAAYGERSVSALIRRLIREKAKEKLK